MADYSTSVVFSDWTNIVNFAGSATEFAVIDTHKIKNKPIIILVLE